MINALYSTPVASIIFALTIGLSLYVFSNPQWYGKLMLHPYSLQRDKSKWYMVLTSGLIHKDWGHLIFNMITFYYFGFSLELMFVQFSGEVGHLLFAGFYLLSLILSDIPTFVRKRNDRSYASLGASGAISAVLFSFIMFEPTAMLGIFLIIPMPAYLFALLFLGYSIWASKNGQDHINHDAHLFGALSGIALTLLLYPWAIRHFMDNF
ncbi:rhomboid family intramembrane serine protease [Sphingobacterium sp. LRF_L2]|uniref:rhomboid family intramembrane serine protease n=1 Tax=Sphingobacterium sp. LRF_L2 TaxID=3369421 RepID=UPI003F62DE02